MKLGEDVLLEIVDIVRRGLVEKCDISEELRKLDIKISAAGTVGNLAESYLVKRRKHDAGL